MAYNPGSLLVRAVMTSVTGLPEDNIVNDFAFQDDDGQLPPPVSITNILAAVDAFYRTPVPVATTTVGEFISRAVNRAATHRLDVYQISAGGLGSPIRSDPWLGPVDAGAVAGVPTECSAVLSFHSDFTGAVEEAAGGTRPKARRRGRLFIGPLALAAINSNVPPYRLANGVNTALREAANRLIAESAAAGAPWSVWSRADQTLRTVVGGWTDDAPDTQRRRGPAPTGRIVWGS